MGETLQDVGEFGLIDRLVAGLPEAAGVLVGPGDDAAVLAGTGARILAAADLLVEGSHFDLAFSSPADVGFKALAVNLSDIAAMGGAPRYALVSLGAPGATAVTLLEDLFGGIAEAARTFGVGIVGGDTVGADRLIVSIAVIGEPGERGPVRRDGARVGDAVCVTGSLGGAAAALALFRAAPGDPAARALLERFPGLAEAHRRGRARVTEGAAAAAYGATSMIDVSDGFGADVGHLARASRVRLHIAGRSVPVAEGVPEVEAWLAGTRPPGEVSLFAVKGGDDYELVFTIAPDAVHPLAAAIAPTPLTRVGSVVEGEGVDIDGLAESEFAALGWDHFHR